MAIRYKIDIVAALKDAGYTSYRIRQEQTINQTALQKLRNGQMVSWEQFDKICAALNSQPGDLIEHVPDNR